KGLCSWSCGQAPFLRREVFQRQRGGSRSRLFLRVGGHPVGMAGLNVLEYVVVLDGEILVYQRGIKACDTLLFRNAGLHGGVQGLVIDKLCAFFPLHHVTSCSIWHTLFFHQHAGACKIIQQRHVLTSTGCLCAVPVASCAGLDLHTASFQPVSSMVQAEQRTRPAIQLQALWSW